MKPDALETAVQNYEGNVLFEAASYRGLPKGSDLPARIEAFKSDLSWYEEHSADMAQRARRAVGKVEQEHGLGIWKP